MFKHIEVTSVNIIVFCEDMVLGNICWDHDKKHWLFSTNNTGMYGDNLKALSKIMEGLSNFHSSEVGSIVLDDICFDVFDEEYRLRFVDIGVVSLNNTNGPVDIFMGESWELETGHSSNSFTVSELEEILEIMKSRNEIDFPTPVQ
jgi:hypothetical protein